MKNVSTYKSSQTDSPKTPGGISRSLLTPCRRIGLSRNFRKSGASPFQSPLSSNTGVEQEKLETRKRKESLEETPQTSENAYGCGSGETSEVVQTPTRNAGRNVELPRRKKSKILLASINKCSEKNEPQKCSTSETKNINNIHGSEENESQKHSTGDTKVTNNIHCAAEIAGNTEDQPTPVSLKSKSKSKMKISPLTPVSKKVAIDNEKENLISNPPLLELNKAYSTEMNTVQQEEIKEKSPNNLTKECVVVIQKKIFKKELKDQSDTIEIKKRIQKPNYTLSQTLFDSDSDDVPLICLNNEEITNKCVAPKSINEDDNFATSKAKINKNDKRKSSKIMMNKPPASTKNKNSSKAVNVEWTKPSNSQSSVDDDDFFEAKRTILIRKSYDKVTKPQKAKSTGSITQKDIDDLKSRIEMKKKLLLARATTEDTKELRDLIKKWQKGCQDALTELMDLMKNKIPDKQNMDYSEILETLKIPAALVGYDSGNDCFLTPNDESIILANFKD